VPTGPAFALLFYDGSGLQHLDTRTETVTTLSAGGTYQGTRALSPGRDRLAFAYRDAEGSKLAVFDAATARLRPVHAAAGPADYSLAWSADGTRLAFGLQTSGGGEGDILIAGADGDPQRLGCTASTQVVHWISERALVVGDGENLHVVDAGDCRTLATTDARKTHHVAFAPGGQHRAYVYRDLVYDSGTRQYTPDSTLYLADPRGDNPKQIYGNERSVRNLAWSPNGTELAVEVAADNAPGRRQVLLYDVNAGTASYLVQPEAGGSITRPVWSPSGDKIAFDWATSGGRQKAVRAFMNTTILSEGHGPTWGWAGDEAVVLPAADGSLQVVGLQGDTILTVPPGRTLLYIHPLPAL
jgi:Tol biopolymer transport system component